MPSLHDLHDALADLENRAPQRPSRAPGRQAHRARYRHTGPILGAAAAVVVLAVCATLLVNFAGSHAVTPLGRLTPAPTTAASTGTAKARPAPAAAPTAPVRPAQSAPKVSTATHAAATTPVLARAFDAPIKPLSVAPYLQFALSPVAGYKTAAVQISPTQQIAQVVATGSAAVQGEIRVYVAGAFNPGSLPAGTTAAVDGRPAYQKLLQLDATDPLQPGNPGPKVQALMWQYATGAWAVVHLDALMTPTGGDPAVQTSTKQPTATEQSSVLADEIRIAQAAHQQSTTIRLPLRLAADMTIVQLNPDTNAGGVQLTWRGATWSIGWSLGSPLQAAGKPDTTTTTVGTRQWIIYGAEAAKGVGLISKNFGLTVYAKTRSLADYRAFINAVALPEHPDSPTSWFTGADALGPN